MRTSNPLTKLMLLVLVALLAAAACGSDDEPAATDDGPAGTAASGGASGSVVVSGSSTVEPVSSRVAELLADENSAVQVTVDGPGTGDGFALFCEGQTDISDASRAIKDEEAQTCADNGVNYVELLVAYDGISVLTNPNNDVECLTFEDIYGLMSAEAEAAGVENWSQASTVIETSQELPDAPLVVSAPGTESGTYDSFIEIVLEGIAEERGQEDFIRTDFAGQAEDNVIIQGIVGADSSFGWVGFAFAEANADVVKELQVDAGDGCIDPTFETIADGSYPVSRPLFIYVNTDKAAENPAVAEYVDFYLSDGIYEDAVVNAFGPDQGYINLPDDLLAETRAAWAGR